MTERAAALCQAAMLLLCRRGGCVTHPEHVHGTCPVVQAGLVVLDVFGRVAVMLGAQHECFM